jgi:hypothetical protein
MSVIGSKNRAPDYQLNIKLPGGRIIFTLFPAGNGMPLANFTIFPVGNVIVSYWF